VILFSGSGDLSHEDNIRKKIVPNIKEDEESKMKAALRGKDIIVHCDETTDRRGRAIFLTLFRILSTDTSEPPKIVVAAVDELDQVNAQTCSQAVIKV